MNERSCPKCNLPIIYKYNWSKTKANKNNSWCRKCSIKYWWDNRKREIHKRQCPICKKEIVYKKKFFKTRADREKRICSECYHKQNVSNETKKKMRISATKRIKQKRTKPYTNYNPNACEYFDKLNEINRWNLQHALNGGEIEVSGYFIDAYDRIKNIIVEYDEPHHYTIDGTLKEKDLKRQKEIITELKCKFFRFNEKQRILYKIKL